MVEEAFLAAEEAVGAANGLGRDDWTGTGGLDVRALNGAAPVAVVELAEEVRVAEIGRVVVVETGRVEEVVIGFLSDTPVRAAPVVLVLPAVVRGVFNALDAVACVSVLVRGFVPLAD